MEAEQKHINGKKVRLLCSYGGKIKSRPTDHQLSYVGGDTKIVAVDRAVRFSEIVAKLNSLSNADGGEISVKYQLPGEDLDSLVSLIDDDDVEHMMVEYDRMQRISAKPARLRIFVFAAASAAAAPPVTASQPNPDYLFGFDKEYQPSVGPPLYLSQIPIPPENGGRVAEIPAAAQAVYRVPAGANEGAYRSGAYSFGLGNGNREQPVYNLVPVMPPMMASMGNGVELNGSRRRF